MPDTDLHPTEASYLAGVQYARDNVIPLTEGEVNAYARGHAEDVEAFVDGYWNTKHREA